MTYPGGRRSWEVFREVAEGDKTPLQLCVALNATDEIIHATASRLAKKKLIKRVVSRDDCTRSRVTYTLDQDGVNLAKEIREKWRKPL